LGKPLQVEIGFHYTQEANRETISRKGLLPDYKRKGGLFGRGIYVGNNPHAFIVYGDVGIILLYMKGCYKQLDFPPAFGEEPQDDSAVDAWRGNKLTKKCLGRSRFESADELTVFPKSPYFDEIVLRRKEQVLPVMMFPRDMINNADMLFQIQIDLQRLVDTFFNVAFPTIVKRILPSSQDLEHEYLLRQQWMGFWNTSNKKTHIGTVLCKGPLINQQLANSSAFYILRQAPLSECPICMSSLSNYHQNGPACCLKGCRHSFHQGCIQHALKYASKCPMCRAAVGEPFGKCPVGTMTIELDPTTQCNGVWSSGTFVLSYDIPGGIQSGCHENPGNRFSGTIRHAYIPNDAPGRDLLKRLKYAFRRGLTFTIGTSLTTGRSNTVIWTSIHHKTSLNKGPHGFPDPGYIVNCNEELDSLGVPKVSDL
jgi:deltex-like protein